MLSEKALYQIILHVMDSVPAPKIQVSLPSAEGTGTTARAEGRIWEPLCGGFTPAFLWDPKGQAGTGVDVGRDTHIPPPSETARLALWFAGQVSGRDPQAS